MMENPIKMDDLGCHYFWKHPYILSVASSPYATVVNSMVYMIRLKNEFDLVRLWRLSILKKTGICRALAS